MVRSRLRALIGMTLSVAVLIIGALAPAAGATPELENCHGVSLDRQCPLDSSLFTTITELRRLGLHVIDGRDYLFVGDNPSEYWTSVASSLVVWTDRAIRLAEELDVVGVDCASWPHHPLCLSA